MKNIERGNSMLRTPRKYQGYKELINENRSKPSVEKIIFS